MVQKSKTVSTLLRKGAQKTTEKAKALTKVIKNTKKERAAYVRQEANMTSEQWKASQVGLDAKWPQPKYMAEDHDGKGATSYRDQTYMTITRWTAETKIAYRPHAKAPGSKSHTRYETYSKAKTVAEALKLGSWPADWCWDYERGFIKVVGGKVRDEPIDSSEVDISTLGEVDRILARWFIREAAKMLGMSLKEISQNSEAKDGLLLRMRRTVAEGQAKEIISEQRKITADDVLSVLQKWGFKKNVTRQNVMPENMTFVFSDTMGLVSDRTGNIIATKYTLAYPHVQKVLCGYLRDSLPKEVAKFPFTSINVNKNYGGRRHRDGNNMGPSAIHAFGSFTGGLLNYFPNDDRSMPVENLPLSDQVKLDLSKNLVIFDGRRGHEVDAFHGERYTLVYFTCPRSERATPETQKGLRACGFELTSAETAKMAQELLLPPSGYSKDTAQGGSGANKKVLAFPVAK